MTQWRLQKVYRNHLAIKTKIYKVLMMDHTLKYTQTCVMLNSSLKCNAAAKIRGENLSALNNASR